MFGKSIRGAKWLFVNCRDLRLTIMREAEAKCVKLPNELASDNPCCHSATVSLVYRTMRRISSILFCLLLIPAALLAQPVVQIFAVDRLAYEHPTLPEWGVERFQTPSRKAAFQVWRSGSVARPLLVKYAVGGTASNGVDYVALPGEVTIPAGSRFARIIVHPIDDLDDETFTGASRLVTWETVVLSIRPSRTYTVGVRSTARIQIFDDNIPAEVHEPHTGGSVGSILVVDLRNGNINPDRYVVLRDYRTININSDFSIYLLDTNAFPQLPERQR